MGLYVFGAVSAGAGTTFVVTKLLPKPTEPEEGEIHASTDDRIEK
jgi:hypothetical protein